MLLRGFRLFGVALHRDPKAKRAKSSVIDCIDEREPIINTELGLSLASTFSATRFEVQTVVEDDNSNVAMITFWVPRDLNFSFPGNHTFTDKEGMKFSFTVEHCGCILPQTGAPGEPPRHETKGEHWRRVGEHLNPSYKNRLTVIAPASAQNSSQKRRFGLLKESHVDYLNQPVSYTYAEETYPWILFLNSLPESEYLDVFLTRFGQCETVKAESGTYLPHSSQRSESLAKHARILLLQLPSGKQCQINRVEGTEEAPYLTKVDALHIYPFKDCQLMLFVPPLLDHRTLLTSTARLVVSKVWSYEPSSNTKLNSTPINPITPQASCAASQQRPTTKDRAPRSQGGATIKNPVPAEGRQDAPQSLPYTPLMLLPPPPRCRMTYNHIRTIRTLALGVLTQNAAMCLAVIRISSLAKVMPTRSQRQVGNRVTITLNVALRRLTYLSVPQ